MDQSNRSEKDTEKPLLYGPDGKPLSPTQPSKPGSITEKSEGLVTSPPPREQLRKLQEILRTKPIQLGKSLVWLVLAFATSIALWQFLVTEPDVRPIDFSAKGPYPARFTVHNPFFTEMYNTQVAVAIGPGMITTGPNVPDLRTPMMQFPGPTTCEEFERYPDLKAVAGRGTIVLDETDYPVIEPGGDIPFVTGITIQGMRFSLAIGVRYRLRILRVPLWSRFTCRMFQTIRDSEGRTHLVPY